MSVLTILNTGLVILLVNFKAKIDVGWLPIMSGHYNKDNVEWYRKIGSTIILTMLFNILSINLANLGFALLYAMRRLYDRKCRRDDRYTRKLTQDDYEDVNTGMSF